MLNPTVFCTDLTIKYVLSVCSQHMMVMQDMLKDSLLGEHLLLVGNQVNEDSHPQDSSLRRCLSTPIQRAEQTYSTLAQSTGIVPWSTAAFVKASAHQLQGELELSVPYGAQALAHTLH